MKVLVLYNEPDQDAAVDEQDVLAQRDAVVAALTRCGHEPSELGCRLDLEHVRRRLIADRPDVVFNLVESLAGTDRLLPVAPLVLEALGCPHTGCSARALYETTGKLHAKRRLRDAGLPTPDWLSSVPTDETAERRAATDLSGRFIIKAVWEHASVGLDDRCVHDVADTAELFTILQQREAEWLKPVFAERFVEGREFNLSLLDGPDGVEVLPPAEIDFSRFPADQLRIVGYRAKWEPASVEYRETPRCFDFEPADAGLLAELVSLARGCWREFDLSGYARVDFRVDCDGQPWILEINGNPCLSPDAGFAAALERAGMPFDQAVGRIVESACRFRGPR